VDASSTIRATVWMLLCRGLHLAQAHVNPIATVFPTRRKNHAHDLINHILVFFNTSRLLLE